MKTGKRAALLCAAVIAVSMALIRLGDDGLPALFGGNGAVIVRGIARVQTAFNFGVSFSLLSGMPFAATLLSALLLLAMLAFIAFARFPLSSKAALAVMFSGGLSNLLSRLKHGFVVDWICLEFMDFPVFNIADIFITLGAAAFVLTLFFRSDHERASV